MSWVSDTFNIHGPVSFFGGLISGVLAPFLLAATSTTADATAAINNGDTLDQPPLAAPFTVLLLIALTGAPIVPLLDTTTLSVLPDTSRYGEVRIWGSIGYGLFAFTTGLVIDRFGIGTNFYMYAVGISLAGTALSAAILRSRRHSVRFHRNEHDLAAASHTSSSGIGTAAAALRGMLAKPGALSLLVVVCVYGFEHAVINSMVPMFLTKDLEASGFEVGVALALALCGEVPCFLASQRALASFKDGPYGVLGVAHLVMAARMAAYALAARTHAEGLALVVQLLHGATFSLPWASLVLIVNSMAPQGLGTTAQSVLHALFVGVAGSVGAFVGSFCYGALGAAGFFLMMACVVLVSYAFVLSKMPRSYGPQIVSAQDFDS